MKKEFNFKITKKINIYHLSGGISSTASPTGWANIEKDFNTKDELLEYVLLRTKKIIKDLDK